MNEKPRTRETAEEIDILGKRILYRPYIDTQPQIQVSPGIKRRAIGEDMNGERILQYEINESEHFMSWFPAWWADHKAKHGTAS